MTIKRTDLEQIMGGQKTLEAQIASGALKLDGDASVLTKLASTMVDFDPRFQIMPGTKVRDTGARRPFPTKPCRGRRSRSDGGGTLAIDRDTLWPTGATAGWAGVSRQPFLFQGRPR